MLRGIEQGGSERRQRHLGHMTHHVAELFYARAEVK
jgi:hypothetical protein